MAENLRIDHVIFGTADIERTAQMLEEEHGLASVAGGRHESRGTGNRILPVGDAYLELMGIVDPDEAAAHPFGRWFSSQIADGDRFLMWCLGTDDIDAVALGAIARKSLGVRVPPPAWALARGFSPRRLKTAPGGVS